MLSAEDLAGMAETNDASLPEPMFILRENAGTSDSWGHKARTNPTEVPVNGYVHDLNGDEVAAPIIDGAVVANAEVRFPFGTPINERDHIRRADGTILEAVYVRDPDGYGLRLEVGVFSVKPVSSATTS